MSVADDLKKIVTAGIGAAFLTEEGVRSLVSEWKLPKDILTALLESAGKTRKDLVNEVTHAVIEKVDVKALVQEILASNDLEFQVKVQVKPKKK